MPRPERFTAAHVWSGLRHTLGTRLVSEPQRTEHGFGNENWRVEVDGQDVLVKITPLEGHPPDKLVAAATASRMAEAAGVPVPQEVFFSARCEAFGGAVTRVQQYLPGHHLDEVLDGRETVDRFFASLGDAVARLHSIRCEAFASRVGGEPRFSTWQHYLRYRLPQVVARSRAVNAYEDEFLMAAVESLITAAQRIAADVEPRLCHRDLSIENVLVDDGGEVVALLDFDQAEPWDCAVDMMKLTWKTFPRFPGAAQSYRRHYFTGTSEPEAWPRRVWVASALELLKVVPNAISSGDRAFEASARRRLHQLLQTSP